MAKALLSKGKQDIPKPTVMATCANCKFMKVYNEQQMVCDASLPPHVSTTGRVPVVHSAYSCAMHKEKE